MSVSVDISYGELIDKITILEIKSTRIDDAEKLKNIRYELAVLGNKRSFSIPPSDKLEQLTEALRQINASLWEIEDDIRDKERAGEFDATFIELARAVYKNNDKRAALKREINELMGSSLIEEKSYRPY